MSLFVPTVFGMENIFTITMIECACSQANGDRRVIIFFSRCFCYYYDAFNLTLFSLSLCLCTFSAQETLLLSVESDGQKMGGHINERLGNTGAEVLQRE